MTTSHTSKDVQRWFDSLDLDLLGTAPTRETNDSTTPVDDGYQPVQQADWADSLEDRFDELAVEGHRVHDVGARRRRRIRLYAGAASVLGVAGAIGLALSSGEATSTAAAHVSLVPATSALPSPPPTAPDGCPTRVDGETTTGAERGGTDSGPNVIFAFEAAYYLARSGITARELAAPDAAVPSAEAIQHGIDSVPTATTHCVRITPAGPDTYAVDLTEHRPGKAPEVYAQIITTTSRDGHVLIASIGVR
ncbi:hypothetical protein ACIBG0_36880 [Nocardia sp. NPDC050630]|uniref:hypothetical protein n=1 Tax=Nocardia sp. NPDC050630 TaxID=3364321 RepID=UPI0037B41231